jgi:hypothetical protein
MVSIINANNDISMHLYVVISLCLDGTTSHVLIFDGYFKVGGIGGSFYVNLFLGQYLLSQIDTKTMSPKFEVDCMVYIDLNSIENKVIFGCSCTTRIYKYEILIKVLKWYRVRWYQSNVGPKRPFMDFTFRLKIGFSI